MGLTNEQIAEDLDEVEASVNLLTAALEGLLARVQNMEARLDAAEGAVADLANGDDAG
jgi:hypothetical protein